MNTAIILSEKEDEFFTVDHPEYGKCLGRRHNGEPLILAKDAAELFLIKNYRQAVKRLDERGVILMDTPTSSGNQKMLWLTEGGLNELAMTSRHPEAISRKRWVCYEVMVTLRKTGTYTMPQVTQSPVALPDYPTLLRQHADLIEKAETLEKQRLLDAPKVELVDNLDATTYRFDDVAKFLPSGMGAPTLRTYLLTKGWIFKTDRKDCPYKAYQHLIDKNLFILHLTPVTNENAPYKVYLRLDFTIKGVKALIDEFHKDGIITSQQRMNDIMMQIVSTCKALVKKAS